MNELVTCVLLCTQAVGVPGAAALAPPVLAYAAAASGSLEGSVPAGQLQQEPLAADPWLSSDKFQHLLLSYAATAFTFAALRTAGAGSSQAVAGAAAGSFALGVAKEVHDLRRGGVFSVRDLIADAVGIAAGYYLLREVR
jgi:uncharacterized protein YfiM (DUF2279 family)